MKEVEGSSRRENSARRRVFSLLDRKANPSQWDQLRLGSLFLQSSSSRVQLQKLTSHPYMDSCFCYLALGGDAATTSLPFIITCDPQVAYNRLLVGTVEP